jgi:hypothetical protein
MVFIGTFESPAVEAWRSRVAGSVSTIGEFVREFGGKEVAGAGFEPATFGL